MKKKILAGLLIAASCTVGLTACNSTPSKTANFEKSQYILSKDESINFFDEISLKGILKDEVTFVCKDQSVLEKTSEGAFKATESGQTLLYAMYGDKVLASVKVVVKYKLTSPQNFLAGRDGVLTWDKSFAIVSNEEVLASEYKIGYKEYDSQDDYTFVTAQTNSYTFDENLSYIVVINAISNNEYVDDSGFCQEFFVNFADMGQVEGIKLGSSAVNQESKVTWKEKSDALYDVYINGFKLFEGIEEEEIAYDFSSFEGNEKINIKIVCYDAVEENPRTQSETTFTLTKLSSPSVEYSFDATNGGRLNWNSVGNNVNYNILIGGSEIPLTQTQKTTTLEGFDAGIYDVSVFASGNADDKFVRSDISQTLNVVKLATPVASLYVEGNEVVINFTADIYKDNYIIKCGGRNYSHSVSADGLTKRIDISSLPQGEQSLSITAIPTLEGTNVKEYLGTSYVLNSQPLYLDFYCLESFSAITHELKYQDSEGQDLESPISEFTFNAINSATDYKVLIGEQEAEDYSWVKEGNKIKVSVKGLNQTAQSEYKITFVAQRLSDEGVALARESKGLKTLKVLPTVSQAEEQSNGVFAWNALSINSGYKYQIYKTASDYSIEGVSLLKEETTFDTKTSGQLDAGYYVVRIYSISSNENLYLNSDFADNNGYFEGKFSVTSQLSSPNVTFSKETGKLEIQCVDNAGGYEVYVDGVLDGTIDLSSMTEKVNYQFAQDFSQAKTYSVEVKAKSGSLYDSNIYLPSNNSSITITKLATPTYTITENFNVFGQKTGETLSVQEVANSTGAEIGLGGVKQNTLNWQLALSGDNYINDFTLTIKAIAQDGANGNYYLDSDTRTLNVVREVAPSAISFENGKINLVHANASKLDGFYLTLVLPNENGDYYYGYLEENATELEENALEIDLQTKINSLLQTNSAFATAYRNASQLKVQATASRNEAEDGAHRLSSQYGLATNGTDQLVIDKMTAPSLTFDSENETLSWTSSIENTTFDIYLDGNNISSDISQKSISLSASVFTSKDWTLGGRVYVKAKNLNCLESEVSNSVKITKLAPIDQIAIGQKGDDWQITIPLTQGNNISQVLVNGEAVSIDTSKTFATKSIDFIAETAISIYLQYNNTVDGEFYINSDARQFTIAPLGELTLTKTGNEISWTNLASTLSRVSKNTIKYFVTVTNGANTWNFTTVDTSLSVKELESKLNTTLDDGQVEIKVYGKVDEGYILSADGKGLFGQSETKTETTKKLSPANIASSSIVDFSSDNAIESKTNAKAQIVWENDWDGETDVKFDVIVKYKELSGQYTEKLHLENLTPTAQNTYSLSKDTSNYILTLSSANFTSEGEYAVEIFVTANGVINSQTSSVNLQRYDKITSASLSDDGILTITDRNNFAGDECKYDEVPKYLVMVEAGASTKSQIISVAEVDLMEFLAQIVGNYKITIIAVSGENKIFASDQAFTLSGYKLQGIEKVSIDDNGLVNFKLYDDNLSDIVFSVKFNGVEKEISPQRDGQTSTFKISMLELLEEFDTLTEGEKNFSVTVKKANSVDADWKEFSFNYSADDTYQSQKDYRLINNYLILDRSDSSTTAFKISSGGSEQYLPATDIMGYWCWQTENEQKVNQQFASSAISGYESYACYAINLDKLFSDISSGVIQFSVSRISKDSDGVLTQHNQQTLSKVKLDKIEDTNSGVTSNYLAIKSSMLVWDWRGDNGNVYAYSVDLFDKDDQYLRSIIVYQKSLDLRSEGLLQAGQLYKISVRALSNQTDELTSNASLQLATIRYTTPSKLDVIDGQLRFNKEELSDSDFITLIDENINSTAPDVLVEMIYDTTFASPLYFTSNSSLTDISNQKAQIRFIRLSSQGVATSEEYLISTNLTNLMFDFALTDGTNYFTRLQAFYEGISSSTKGTPVKALIQSILASNQGIGLGRILFDDLGREIPAGDYQVQVRQLGGIYNIDSDWSELKTLTVTPAPSITLGYREITDENRVDYIATLTPNSEVAKYKMYLRYNYGLASESRIELDITHGTSWVMTYEGNEISALTETAGTLEINLNTLRTELDAKLSDKIRVNQEIKVDIFACFNDGNLNGKSAQFTVTYCDLNSGDVSFSQGRLSLKEGVNENGALVRYKVKNVAESRKVITGAEITFDSDGFYEYIILSLNGGITGNNVYVESQRYEIRNLYKLSAPTLGTFNNNLQIACSSFDKDYLQNNEITEVVYMLANNQTNTYATVSLSGENQEYEVGENEKNANNFKIYLQGNGGEIQLDTDEENASSMAEFVMKLASGKPLILTSKISSLNAKMISPSNITYDRGDITWAEAENSATEGEIIYKVTIEYFSTSASDTDTTQKETEILYTTGNAISSDLIENNWTEYNIKITPLIAKPCLQTDENAIETLEGKYFSTAYTFVSADGTNVLRGVTTSTGKIARTATPTNLTVSDGKITFESGAKTFKYFAKMGDSEVELKGTQTISNGKVTFIPDDGILQTMKAYTIYVYAYANGALASKPVSLEKVYRLRNLDGLYSVITKVENNKYVTALDFSAYFENVTFDANDNTSYKIVVGSQTEANGEWTQKVITASDDKTFVLDGLYSVAVSVQSNTTSKNILSSSQIKFTIKQTEVLKTDALGNPVDVNGDQATNEEDYVYLLDCTWNEEKSRFELSWNDENTKSYQYYILINFDNNTKESAYVSENFYQPINMGSISQVLVKARQISQDEDTLHLFSRDIILPQENVSMDLFEAGNGSEENPYIINTAEQFKNISLRNIEGKDYHFKLGDNLTISQSDLMQEGGAFTTSFYGHLDGNGKTITFSANNCVASSASVSIQISTINTTKVTINNLMSMFNKIEKGASVENLDINFSATLDSSISNVLLASLAGFNYGKISNVNLTNCSIGIAASSKTIVGGLVGFNYGQITSCQNNASLSCLISESGSVGFGGICAVNASNAEITNCVNNASKTFKVSNNKNATVYASGIALVNYSKITSCGNDGDFILDAKQTSVSAYFAGISITSNNGTISGDSYNNGAFSLSNSGLLYKAEISYY